MESTSKFGKFGNKLQMWYGKKFVRTIESIFYCKRQISRRLDIIYAENIYFPHFQFFSICIVFDQAIWALILVNVKNRFLSTKFEIFAWNNNDLKDHNQKSSKKGKQRIDLAIDRLSNRLNNHFLPI